jgi:hypothetical protein
MQTGPRFLTEDDLNVITTTKDLEYGAEGVSLDGNRYKYAKIGGTSTYNPGWLLVAAAAPANSTGLAIAASNNAANLKAGSQTLVVTNGATAVTENEFDYLEVIVSAGGSYKLRLVGNSAAAASGAITLRLRDPLPPNATTLIAGTDTVNLRYSVFNGPTASTTQAAPVGFTTTIVPNTSTVTYYGWLLVRGETYVAATAATKGQAVAQDLSGTAGFVKVYGAVTDGMVGTAVESAASNKASVFVNIS